MTKIGRKDKSTKRHIVHPHVLHKFFKTKVVTLLKRRDPQKFKMLQRLHMFGNLLAVMIVSIHFTQEVTKAPQSRRLGTGIVVYATMILLAL